MKLLPLLWWNPSSGVFVNGTLAGAKLRWWCSYQGAVFGILYEGDETSGRGHFILSGYKAGNPAFSGRIHVFDEDPPLSEEEMLRAAEVLVKLHTHTGS